MTGRIDDRLVGKYGRANVFKDVDNIPLGVDFRDVISAAVGRCRVLLAVIGPQWLLAASSAGRPRLDDPRDFVRLEIEAALGRGIPIIPVLVNEAVMPGHEQLPLPLQALAFRNGIAVRRDPDFHRDMDRLLNSLDQMLQGRTGPLAPPVEREQPKLAALRSDGLTNLRQLLREALDRGQGKITKEDNAAVADHCRRHHVSNDEARASSRKSASNGSTITPLSWHPRPVRSSQTSWA